MGRELACVWRQFFGGVFHGRETSGHSKPYTFQDIFMKIGILTVLFSFVLGAEHKNVKHVGKIYSNGGYPGPVSRFTNEKAPYQESTYFFLPLFSM